MGRPVTCVCGSCAKCKARARAREWYENNREAALERGRERRRSGREYEIVKWRRHNDPEYRKKWLAQRKLQYAVRVGNVERQPCEVCGASDEVHGHHDDHGRPLDVRWLCPRHHEEWHTKSAYDRCMSGKDEGAF